MAEAVRLACNGLWAAAPNPCVGALLTRDGAVVAEGWHTGYGKPHAEVEALRDAREKGVELKHCTLWVTLEPCNHHGKTPPCTKAIIEAGVPEVVVGCLDPNPDVQGGGVEALRRAGVTVHVGVAEEKCRDLIADFLVWKHERRPYVFLKLAATLDGRIATRSGHSQWVSCEASRRRVHWLRRHVQAVLVGGNTFREDDPELTCRLLEESGEGGGGPQPLAVVLTSRLPAIQEDSGAEGCVPVLVARRPRDTVFFTGQEQAAGPEARNLRKRGCKVWGLPELESGGYDLMRALRALLMDLKCHYLLCEGGGGLGLSLLEAGLVDEFQLFLAPKILGDEQARPLFQGRCPETMAEALGLRLTSVETVGEDVLLTLRPRGDSGRSGGEGSCSRG